MQKDGYSLLLPTGTLDYFDVVNVHEDSTAQRKKLSPKPRLGARAPTGVYKKRSTIWLTSLALQVGLEPTTP